MNKKYLRLIGCSLLVSALLVVSCDSSDEDPGGQPNPEFDRLGMLTNYADNLIIPAYVNLQGAVNQMADAASTFAAEPNISNLESLQSSLKVARISWQQANFFQFGPAETNTLRVAANTYPTDTQKINDNIQNGGYTLGSIDNIAAGGLPAIDYLLHGLGESPEEIVEAFTTAPEASGRLTYLTDNGDFIKSNVDNVVAAWDPAGDDYRGAFLSPSNGGNGVGSSAGLLVNAIILHYERFMRDGKIGIPAGVRSAGVPRPTATEAFYGGYSAELAADNVEAFKNLYNGGIGSGLDDYLVFMEANSLSNDIRAGLDQAIYDVNLLTDPLSDNVENDNDLVLAAFTSMQEVLVLLKVDMTSILGITITNQDNDGD